MNVILLDNVENLGSIGDLVKVKPGYGRNYLIPQGKAALTTPENMKQMEARRAEQRHTVSLTRAQRYVLRELRVLFEGTGDEDLRQQVTVLEAAYRRPNPRPAVRGELNRVRREGIAGQALLDAMPRRDGKTG